MDFKVKNITNENWNKAANQFEITTKRGRYFQSYDSVVAKKDFKTGRLTLSANWDYSNTTRKHLYIWLRDTGFRHYLPDNGNNRKALQQLIDKKVIAYKDIDSLPLV